MKNYTVEPPVTTACRNQPPLFSDQFSKYQKLPSKSLYLESLVSDNPFKSDQDHF